MGKNISRIIFISLFLLMLFVPLVAIFFQKDQIAAEENRPLAQMAEFSDRPWHFNRHFPMAFEAWVNDHIGFRKYFVEQNGRLHYYLFRKFPIGSPSLLGPEEELNFVRMDTIMDYQHKNLYPEDYLKKAAESLNVVGRYVEERGAGFYYYQCWDKHSIYPEQFPKEILQYGSESKTDGIVRAFVEGADVAVISPKQELIAAKGKYETYSVWGDPTHWTQRGAYIGYLKFMEAVNKDAELPYTVLGETDYDITLADKGLTLYGKIHKEDILEQFELKNPKAELTRDRLSVGAEDQRSLFFTNDSVDNDTRLIIVGDSYFHFYILDDIAESFHETIFFWGDHLKELPAIMDAYAPDIVVVENAEREDRTEMIIDCAEAIR